MPSGSSRVVLIIMSISPSKSKSVNPKPSIEALIELLVSEVSSRIIEFSILKYPLPSP